MKKLMLSAFLIGLVTASCGTKEPKMSSDRDSTTVTNDSISMQNSRPMQSADTMQMPVDTVTAPTR